MTKRKKVSRPVSILSFIQAVRAGQQAGWSVWILIGTLAILSLISGANFESEKHIFVAGQIADSDVRAERDLLVEDTAATREKQKQAAADQPQVYDLSMESYRQFQARIVEILRALNNNANPATDPVLQKLADDISEPVAEEILPQLKQREVQTYILKKLLPQIREQLANGLVWDFRAARLGSGGLIVQNLDDNTAMLRPDLRSVPDTQSYLAEISTQLRSAPELNSNSRRAINILLASTVPASLTPNREATQKKTEEAIQGVQPVYYQVQRGELIIRKGDKVTREQQLKMQTLFNSYADPVRWQQVGGVFVIGLILSIGFFISPSGRPGTPLRPKDLALISVILLIFGIAAKATMIFGQRMDSLRMINALEIAFPVTGAVGLVSMVFSAKRYGTMGLLLSFYCALMFQAQLPLFLYYFLGGMLATWLVTRSQNRQDVVWSVAPLSAGLFLIWAGFEMAVELPTIEIPMQLIAILINSFLSLIILFALSPVLEMVFGYSTRFRLMELMSLEHPLMQEIMVTIPGTYHHSLVVANMVEAGAKAIGANSLLCKVAALYHDAGKLLYPEYFIENQFGAPNKHDRLTPSMSALILFSHVKKGKELAEKYNLGQEIIDIIRQHHGTRLMKFFYHKSLDLGEKPNEADFSYPGPRPQSKEAAILMLADSVEASSRTLSDPTPARIKNHIDNIIKGIFSEGQLDESELTFKDLHLLSENFQRILTGIFHQRIAYPESKIKTAQQEKQEGKPKVEPEKPKQEQIKKSEAAA